VIVAGVELATAIVVSGKVAVVALAATFTLAPTVAALLLLCSETEMPPAGAGPARVTVPVDPVGPTTAVGFKLTDESSGLTVSVVVTLAPAYEAVIVTGVELLTPRVVTGKVAVLALAATFTLIGTVAALVGLLCRVTVMPPAGAGPAMVTVPVDGLGPATAVGLTLTDEIASGLMVSAAGVGVTELYVAEMCAVVTLFTPEVVMVNVPEVLPAATVAVVGTTAEVLSLLNDTTAPPAGAGLFRVRVPVELLPPTTLVGFTLTAVRVATGVMVKVACTLVAPFEAVM